MSEVLYEHYKGGLYRMICIATNATNDAPAVRMVVYQGQDGEYWTRPYAEFYGLTDDGKPRFARVKR